MARRPRALLALIAVLSLLHAGLIDQIARQAMVFGGRGQAQPRLEARFEVELRPAPPAPGLVRPAIAVKERRARASTTAVPVQPASAGASSPVAEVQPAEPVALAEPATERVEDAELAPAESTIATRAPPVDLADTPTAASETPRAADWPLSTRLSYVLTGYYRGPVDGRAQVDWVREGERYQVHLDVWIGPRAAPLMSRRMTSSGQIGPRGLTPRLYEEETRMVFRDPRRLVVSLDEHDIRLANGNVWARPAGVQDTASQFVQLTWIFTTQPEKLRAGESVPIMLALPRRIDEWVYEVLAADTLYTAAGPIEALHVRPRRPARPDGELTAEMWIAPSLQYLPVRIVIRQDAETYVDMLLDRWPRQAAPGEGGERATASPGR